MAVKRDDMQAVLRLAEIGGGNMLATNNVDEESAMLRGFLLGSLFVEGGADTKEALVLLKTTKLMAEALAYRRSQGNEIPDGVLSSLPAEEVQKARVMMEQMAQYVEDKFFGATTDTFTMAAALQAVDIARGLTRDVIE